MTSSPRKGRPATSPSARENQLISLAVDLAEEQLRAGTASSQVITHFLKLATTREELEREKLAHENELLRVRSEAIRSSQSSEKMYKEALNAMRLYSGQAVDDDREEDPDDDGYYDEY